MLLLVKQTNNQLERVFFKCGNIISVNCTLRPVWCHADSAQLGFPVQTVDYTLRGPSNILKMVGTRWLQRFGTGSTVHSSKIPGSSPTQALDHSPKIRLLGWLATLNFPWECFFVSLCPHSDELVTCLCCTLPSPEGQHTPASCNAMHHFTSVKWLTWMRTGSCMPAACQPGIREDNVPMLVTKHLLEEMRLSYLNVFKCL